MVMAVHVVGENRRLSLLRRWLDCRVGQSLRRYGGSLPAIMVVGLTAAACFAGGTIASAGRDLSRSDADPERFPVTVLSSPNHAFVSWQVRSSGSARLRLYRSVPGAIENLVGEFTTEAGISAFEMVDDARPPGAVIYQIRAVGIGGSERILGSILCVESGFSTRVATLTWDSSHQEANSTSVSEIFLPTEELTHPEDRPVCREPRRRPDPPVPRSEPLRS
jgi:hypothetical protein